MRCNHACLLTALAAVLLVACSAQAWCAVSFAHSASDSIAPFLVVGELSLFSNKQEAVQGAKALVATGLATELLKFTVRERRPNSDSTTSFPSGHTSAAFAMATVLADYKPAYKLPAYAVASAIGWSRVEVGAHRWGDVVAGALLGHFIARRFTNDHIAVSAQGIGVQWRW